MDLYKKFFSIFSVEKHIGKIVFFVLAVITLFLMLFMSKDAGVSGDEHFHLGHARDVMNFYKTLGKDSTATHVNLDNGANDLHMFGQLPDNISYLIYNTFKIDNIMFVRHLVCTTFGWIAMFFAAMLAFRISGRWRAAIFTFCILFCSPLFLGHSFNNLKDPPFASMLMMGTYYLFYFFQTLPKPPKKVIVMLAVSIGLSLGVRVGGLLLIAYFGVFAFIYFVLQWWEHGRYNKSHKKHPKPKKEISLLFKRLFIYGIGISIAGFLLGILLWPYALVDPTHVFDTFKSMSQWDKVLRQVFEGTMLWSDSNPWYYLPKYILITIPIVTIIGSIIYPFIGGLKKKNIFDFFIVYFAFIFPVFWIIYTGANLYCGWRHATFMYPPMVVAAGLGFDALVEFLKNKYLKIAAIALPFLLLILPLKHIIKNHPYEYVYFNELVGGTKKAYGQYELDYYYHSTRAASEWIIANAEKSGLETGDKIKVVTWHPPSVSYFFRHDTAKFEVGFSRWYERGNGDWDYAIFVTTGINPVILRNGTYPPANTVHTIDVDGVPIASILKRTDKKDYYGYLQMQEGNIDSAKILFKQSLEILPKNESVLTNLSNIYLQQGLFDSAIFYLNQFLAFEPNNESANYMSALANYYKKDYNQALAFCKELSRNNPKSSNGYSLAANIYLQMNDIYSAEKELLKLMDAGGFDNNAANQLMNIYKAQGILDERVAQRKMFKHLAESFRKLGNNELADQYEAASRN